MKSVPDMVIYSAPAHGAQGVRCHGKRNIGAGAFPAAQQKKQRVRRGKFGSMTESAVDRVEGFTQPVKGLGKQRCVKVFRFVRVVGWIDSRHNVLSTFQDIIAALIPGICNAGNKLDHARSVAASSWRDIGCCEKRFFIRCHDNGQGPAAAAGQGLAKAHVYCVNVRAFLAVDLDADKILIEQLRDLRVFE